MIPLSGSGGYRATCLFRSRNDEVFDRCRERGVEKVWCQSDYVVKHEPPVQWLSRLAAQLKPVASTRWLAPGLRKRRDHRPQQAVDCLRRLKYQRDVGIEDDGNGLALHTRCKPIRSGLAIIEPIFPSHLTSDRRCLSTAGRFLHSLFALALLPSVH